MDIKVFTHTDIRNRWVLGIDDNIERSYFIYYPNYFNTDEKKYVKTYLDGINDFKYNLNPNKNGFVRLQKWHQKDGKYFCPKWRDKLPWWQSSEYDKPLINIQNKVQYDIKNNTKLGNLLRRYNIDIPNINSCLINKYRDGRDHIAPHSDTYHSFGKTPTICGISIGEPRVFRVKSVVNNYQKESGLSKKDNAREAHNFDYLLEDGSLFIMAGASQKYFSHEIIKGGCDNVRYSLTFREFIN